MAGKIVTNDASAPMLEADSIWKAFGGRKVLQSASLRVRPGEVRALLGRNGVGKTTLLRVAAGMTRADSGIVSIDRVRYERPNLAVLSRAGVCFWPTTGFFSDSYAVGRQLEMFRRAYGTGNPAAVAKRAQLGRALARQPSALSPGERREAEMTAVLIRNPRYLLADEPLQGLSPIGISLLCVDLRTLAESGTGVVITGHQADDILAMADSVTWCESGTTRELGSSCAARKSFDFAQGYLDG